MNFVIIFFVSSLVHHRYEDEINKRNNLENDFVILKKVSTQYVQSYRCGDLREALHCSSPLFTLHSHVSSFNHGAVPLLIASKFREPDERNFHVTMLY